MEHAQILAQIRDLVRAHSYRVRSHCVQHMVEEGFDENQIIEALNGKLRVLEEYPDENRLLLMGYFHFSPTTRCALHLVCDVSRVDTVDLVTAYIPHKPWWISPTQRGQS